MFDIRNVSVSYGDRPILQNASVKVEDGERASIIGPNGTGKSTLLKIIAGEITPESGTVSVPKNTEIGYLPQHLELASALTVLDECRGVFTELLEHEREMRELEEKMAHAPHDSDEFSRIADRYEYLLHETERRDLYSMDATIGRVLDGLGFEEKDRHRPCREFSGGWQMRLLLAKLLLRNPDILLLDEPTNHLDIESIEWLAGWIRQHEGSVLMVSHERAFMDALSSKIVEIDRGDVVVYKGNFTEAVEKRKERRDIQQRTYENQQREIAHLQQFIDRFRYQASKAALVQSRVKQLEKMEVVKPPTPDQDTIHFRFPKAPRSAKEVVVGEGIEKSYGSQTVLGGIDVTLYRGEKVAIVGVNGAGKTTLMRILAGRDDNYNGHYYYGANVEMSYFAQYDDEDLHPENTVLGEFLADAPLQVSSQARGILGAFLFSGEEVDKRVKVLSGGERTRLRLARMLCGKSNLLLLDEPTNHLDIGSRLTLEEALRQYEGTVMLVSHDRYFLDNVVTRVIEIRDGQATSYPGNYTDYLQARERIDALSNGQSASAAPSSPGSQGAREPAANRKVRKDRQRAAQNRHRKAEKEMAECEKRVGELAKLIEELEEEMADPAVTSDFERVSELGKKLQSFKDEKDRVETHWLELQEEIEGLQEELASS